MRFSLSRRRARAARSSIWKRTRASSATSAASRCGFSASRGTSPSRCCRRSVAASCRRSCAMRLAKPAWRKSPPACCTTSATCSTVWASQRRWCSRQLRDSRVGNLKRMADLLISQGDQAGRFLEHDERGREMPGYLAQLGEQPDHRARAAAQRRRRRSPLTSDTFAPSWPRSRRTHAAAASPRPWTLPSCSTTPSQFISRTRPT